MNPSIQRFLAFWRERDVSLRRGVETESLAAFEQKYGVVVPEDFREFLLLSNGTDETLMEYLAFWPVQEMQRVTEVFSEAGYEILDPQNPAHLPHAASYLVFADYLIHSFFYAIALDSAAGVGNVVFVDGTNWYRCARSFSDFIDCYLREAASLAFGGFLPPLKSSGIEPEN